MGAFPGSRAAPTSRQARVATPPHEGGAEDGRQACHWTCPLPGAGEDTQRSAIGPILPLHEVGVRCPGRSPRRRGGDPHAPHSPASRTRPPAAPFPPPSVVTLPGGMALARAALQVGSVRRARR